MFSPTFLSFLTARMFVHLASSILSVAVGWHLYQATGDPFDLALVGLMQILPIAGLFIVSGWVVDNFARNRILIGCTALQGVVYLGLGFSFGEEDFSRTTVFALLFLNGVGRAFFGPALQATLPNIVERHLLSKAVAVSSTVWTVAATAGPFFAGLLIAWIDTRTYWLMASFALCATLLFLLLPNLRVKKSTESGAQQLLDGIRYVLANPYVLPGISLDLFIVLLGSVVALLPVYAADILKVGPEALGLLRAMPALGAVMAGVVIARLPPMRRTGKQLFVALGFFAFSILAFATSRTLWFSLGALWLYGASDMVSVNIRSTLIQLATPDGLRGRVSAVNSLFIATSNDLGDFRAGAVASLIGPVATVLTGGLMALGIAMGGYVVFPALRRLDRLNDAERERES